TENLHLIVAENDRHIGLRRRPDLRKARNRPLAGIVAPPPFLRRYLHREILAAAGGAELVIGIETALIGMHLRAIPLSAQMPHIGRRRQQRPVRCADSEDELGHRRLLRVHSAATVALSPLRVAICWR